MSERLTAALEDGTLDKLRTLAGGERKVGAYLSQIVAWLWPYREDLDAVGLSGCVLQRAETEGAMLATLEKTRAALDATRAIDARLDALEASFRELGAKARANEDMLQQLLPTQEDGGHNDA